MASSMNVRKGQNLSAQAHELVMIRVGRMRRRPGDLAGPAGVVLAAGAAATAALAHWEVGANRCLAVSRLSFRRIMDVPFGICMIALES